MNTRLSIVQRLTVASVAALAPLLVLLVIGGWWLMRQSQVVAADRHLAARVESVEEYIRSMLRAPPPDGLQDEMAEYARLSAGDILLEVTDESGEMLCGPLLAGWDRHDLDARPVNATADGERFFDERFRDAPFRVVASDVRLEGRVYHVIAALPMAAGQDALRRFTWTLAAVLPLALIAAGFGVSWIARRALAPVDRLTRSAQAITVHDLDRRLEVPPADDEIRRLTLTLNDMLARLELAVADIRRFTADAAHELRTPVTLLRTTADLALSKERSPDEYREAIASVLQQSEQMSGLVADLLSLARLDAGVGGSHREFPTADATAVVQEVGRWIAPEMDSRGLRFDVVVPDTPIHVAIPPEGLRRILVMLLDNAAKYTAAGSVRLEVSCEPVRRAVCVRVEDTGIGVDPDEQARVFDRFFRGTSARQRVAEGAGLGLAISLAIAERYGGRIELTPTPGAGAHGTVARLWLTMA